MIGKYGVELFFLISGYVILMSAARKKTAWAFAKARFLRLFPTFWACMAVTLALAFVLADLPPVRSWGDLVVNAIMFPKFFGCEYIDGVYWTLELELIFYAFVFTLLLADRLHWLIQALSIASLVTSIGYFFELRAASLGSRLAPFVFRIFFLMIDGKAYLFLLGVLFYQCRQTGWRNMYWYAIAIAIVGALADERISVPLLTCVVGLFAIALRMDGKVNIHPILLWLGMLSYPLYLLHNRIGRAALGLTNEKGIDSWFALLVIVVAMLLMSHLVVQLVEYFRPLKVAKPALK